MEATYVLFVALLRFTVRSRRDEPRRSTLAATGFVAVMLGMLFARYSHLAFPRLPWEFYYGLPALTTAFLPPWWLGMSWREIGQYLPLAWLTAPVIHLVFSVL